MKARLILAPVLAGALALMTTGASAAPKTLDGKKVKKLTMTVSGGLQDNDSANVTEVLTTPDRADCAPPRCARLPFVYKPAKGVKGDVMFTITWSNPLTDYDLYVAEIARDGSAATVEGQQCASSGGTSEKVFVTKDKLKPGKTYAMVVDFFRSANDTVKGTVEMGPSTLKHTVPDQYDGKFPGTLIPINCTQ
jgi:surface antigen